MRKGLKNGCYDELTTVCVGVLDNEGDEHDGAGEPDHREIDVEVCSGTALNE